MKTVMVEHQQIEDAVKKFKLNKMNAFQNLSHIAQHHYGDVFLASSNGEKYEIRHTINNHLSYDDSILPDEKVVENLLFIGGGATTELYLVLSKQSAIEISDCFFTTDRNFDFYLFQEIYQILKRFYPCRLIKDDLPNNFSITDFCQNWKLEYLEQEKNYLCWSLFNFNLSPHLDQISYQFQKMPLKFRIAFSSPEEAKNLYSSYQKLELDNFISYQVFGVYYVFYLENLSQRLNLRYQI